MQLLVAPSRQVFSTFTTKQEGGKEMRKLLLVLLMVGVLSLVATPAFAQARYGIQTSRPLETTGVFTDRDGNAMDYAVYVYGISIFADAANSALGVYDTETITEVHNATVYAEDEIGEAVAYDSQAKWYDKPVYYSDGVSGLIQVGVGFVHYGPAP